MHMTVAQLEVLLAKLPKGVRIGPSVGNWSLTLWDANDEEMIGTIHKSIGAEFVIDLFEHAEHLLER